MDPILFDHLLGTTNIMTTLPHPKVSFSLWLGLLGAPTIWLFNLLTSYLLVLYVCKGGPHFTLQLLPLIYLSLTAVIIVKTWLNHKSIPPKSEDDDAVLRERRFLTNVGLLISILFFLIILAQTIPTFVLDPCVF
jgi:hypothetical protein